MWYASTGLDFSISLMCGKSNYDNIAGILKYAKQIYLLVESTHRYIAGAVLKLDLRNASDDQITYLRLRYYGELGRAVEEKPRGYSQQCEGRTRQAVAQILGEGDSLSADMLEKLHHVLGKGTFYD
jgi:hypothetical protein